MLLGDDHFVVKKKVNSYQVTTFFFIKNPIYFMLLKKHEVISRSKIPFSLMPTEIFPDLDFEHGLSIRGYETGR